MANAWPVRHASVARLSRTVLYLALAIAFASLQQPSSAQQSPDKPPDDVIRVTTNLIQVRAVVTDRKGQLVDDLKQDDFEILENDRPQTVSFFSRQRIPDGTSSAKNERTPVSTGEQSEEPATRAKPSRSIVILVDTLHLSNVGLIRAKTQLKRFVDEQISDEDTVAVVTPSGELGVLQQFMRDRKRLAYAIDKISGLHRSASLFTPYLAAKVLQEPMPTPPALSVNSRTGFGRPANTPPNPGNPVDDARDVAQAILSGESDPTDVFLKAREILSEEGMLRRATLTTLQETSEHLASMPGQRMMLFVSDGFTLLSEGGGADHQEFGKAISRAVRSGVIIYSFSPEGLTVPVEFTAASPVQFNSTQPTLGASFSSLMADSRTDQQTTLRSLSGDTGGAALLNSNDINGQLKRMLDANRIYYALAYYPQGEADKKFRNLRVRVRDHPDYKVRTQRGYQPGEEKTAAVATTPQERLFQAMIAPLPVTGIELTSSASFLARPEDQAQVTLQVHIGGDSLNYPETGDKHSMNLEVAVVVFDRSGKIVDRFIKPMGASFTAEQFEKARRNGYRYSERLNLSPGLFQIRVGVRDLNGDDMGTSTAWIEVPALHNRKLVLSSLFLGKNDERGQLKEIANRKTAQLELVIGAASIKSGELISYRFVVYNFSATADPATDLVQKTEVLRLGTRVYEGEWRPLSERIVRRNSTALEVGGQLRLGVEPGVYSMHVLVKDKKSGQSTSQVIEIEIKP